MHGWCWRRSSIGSTAASLKSPYERSLAARIHEATFQKLVGSPLVAKARIIKDLGDKAAHEAKAVPAVDAIAAVRELFHVSYWVLAPFRANGATRKMKKDQWR
jgi:type I restriction enzyme, R subunit